MSDRTKPVVEFPATGSTYHFEQYGVYAYGTYGRHSVNRGQTSRQFLGSYDTLAEAREKHPDATVSTSAADARVERGS